MPGHWTCTWLDVLVYTYILVPTWALFMWTQSYIQTTLWHLIPRILISTVGNWDRIPPYTVAYNLDWTGLDWTGHSQHVYSTWTIYITYDSEPDTNPPNKPVTTALIRHRLDIFSWWDLLVLRWTTMLPDNSMRCVADSYHLCRSSVERRRYTPT
jgi:hypothetical protein